MGNGQILVAVLRVLSVVEEVHALLLLGIVGQHHVGNVAPAHQVEIALRLHGQLQTALHLHNLQGLVGRVGSGVGLAVEVHAILALVVANHLRAASGTVAHLVHQRNGGGSIAQLSFSLGPHEQHVGIAEHDAVHGAGPVAAVDEVGAHEGRVDVVLQRHVVAIQAARAAPVGRLVVHHEVGVEHIGQSGHAHGEEQARVGIVGQFEVLVVEGIEQRQSVGIGAIGIDQVLRGFVEVAAAVGHVADVGHNQTIRPVEVAIGGTVVHAVLYGPERLYAVLILRFGAEVVVQVFLQVVAGRGVDSRLGVGDDLLQVVLVDRGHSVRVGIVLTIGLVEIDLGQEGSTGGLGGTALVGLLRGQVAVGFFQVLGNECPALVVGIFAVAHVVVLFFREVGAHHEGNVLVEALEQEVGIGAQKLGLGQALGLQCKAVVARLNHGHGGIHTREGVVESHPHVVDVPVGGEHALFYFELVEHVAVVHRGTAFIGIVGAHVEVPHRERRVDVLGGGEDGIGRCDHVVYVGRVLHLFVRERALRLLVV